MRPRHGLEVRLFRIDALEDAEGLFEIVGGEGAGEILVDAFFCFGIEGGGISLLDAVNQVFRRCIVEIYFHGCPGGGVLK